jgi:hypothetical protein
MNPECIKCIPKDVGHRTKEPDCVNCQLELIKLPDKFNVDFCPKCPRRATCHFRGCILDSPAIKL